MKLKYLSALLILSITINYCYSQNSDNGYEYRGKISPLNHQKIYLAHYFGSKQQVIVDSTLTNENGEFTFKGTNELPEGLYMLNYSPNQYFDLIITEKQFTLSTDTLDLIENMRFSGSKENTLFYEYQSKMRDFSIQIRAAQMNNNSNEFNEYRKKALDFQKNFIEKNQGLFVSKVISATIEPTVPPYTKELVTREDTLARNQFAYQYYKNHYFDLMDLNDSRLIRTPFLERKIDYYFNNLVPQIPDSVIQSADNLLKLLKETELKRYIVYKITNTAENSNILGMDEVFVHMGEEYYIKNQGNYDSTLISSFKNRIKTIKPLLNGRPLPTLYLADTLGKDFLPDIIKANYLVVFFYDPDCSHCKEAAPKLLDLRPYFEEKDIKLLAVSIEREKTKWMEFIKNQGFEVFNNGIDIHINPNTKKEEYYVDFYNVFDVISTPTLFILDKDKKILVKKIGVEEIKSFIDYMEAQN